MSNLPTMADAENVRAAVRDGYGKLARQGSDRRQAKANCCGSAPVWTW